MTQSAAAVAVGITLLIVGCSSSSGDVAQEPVEAAATVVPTQTPTAVPAPSPTPIPVATTTPEPSATPEPTATTVPSPTPTPTFVVPVEPLFVLQGESQLTTSQTNEIMLFVEAVAGRPFEYPPTIILQSQDGFRGGLLQEFTQRDDRPELQARRLQALGFSTIGVDEFTRGATSTWAGSVSGYYSSQTDAVYMPRTFPDEFFAQVLAHELMHALDAQFYDFSTFDALLDTSIETGNYEPIAIASFIIEGRATTIDNTWTWPAGWPAPKPAQLFELGDTGPESGEPPLELPRVVYEELSAPYRFGNTYIRSQGGVSETWDLFDQPPASTEVLLVPGSEGQAIVDVPVPQADGDILETRIEGALDVGLLLHGRGSLYSNARGWAGGASVMWGDDESTCIRIAVATDTEADRERLLKTFGRWVAAGDDRTAEIEDELIVATSCAPFIP